MGENIFFVVAQKALIKKDNKYLILKRAEHSKNAPGYWDLPGGKLENGECAKEGIVREVKEETNFEIKKFSPVFTFTDIVKEGRAFLVVYECEVNGELKLSNDHSEFEWVTKEEILKKENLMPFLKKYLEGI